MTDNNSAISVRNLWQVFGPHPEKLVGSPDAALPRAELRAKFLGEGRDVEVAEYVPKMNVTPNAVALKDD